jgi:hypothetical protein
MKKPLLWINALSSVLHDGLNRAVSYELRSTASDICSRRKPQTALLSAPKAMRSTADDRADRKVA